MAEDYADPRETPLHPRRRTSLVGHGEAEAHLLQAVKSGKLHHAWLISGQRGIGKATLAYRFARFLLSPDAVNMAGATKGLAANLVFAGTHPDLLVIERSVDAKHKKLKTEVAVDDARECGKFFALTAGFGGYRVCVVDSGDDLNGESANSLLKVIEEPPEKSVILIVVHKLGAVLPTIRSRCIHLPLKPITAEQTEQVLAEVSKAATPEIAEAARLSQGSPGRALQLLDSKGAKAYSAFLAAQRLSPAACVSLGMNFAHRDTAEDFTVFSELLTSWVAAEARRHATAGRGLALAKAHDEITRSIRQTDALNLDRRQTVVDALMLLGDVLKAS